MNRIKELREARGMSMQDLANAIVPSTTSSQINKLEKGMVQLTEAWIIKLATALSVSPIEIVPKFGEISSRMLPISCVRVIGEVQAGIWKESHQWGEDDTYEVPYGVGSKYINYAYGLRVAGDSMNLEYPEGTIVVVCPIWNFQDRIVTGDHVLVQRCMKNGVCETTLKEIEIKNSQVKLWPRSTNPKYQEPIDIAWPYTDPQAIDLETVEIKGIVLGSYRERKVT